MYIAAILQSYFLYFLCTYTVLYKKAYLGNCKIIVTKVKNLVETKLTAHAEM